MTDIYTKPIPYKGYWIVRQEISLTHFIFKIKQDPDDDYSLHHGSFDRVGEAKEYIDNCMVKKVADECGELPEGVERIYREDGAIQGWLNDKVNNGDFDRKFPQDLCDVGALMSSSVLLELSERFSRNAEIMNALPDMESKAMAKVYDRCAAELVAVLKGYPIPASLAFRDSWQFLKVDKV